MIKTAAGIALSLLLTPALADETPHCRVIKLASLPIEFVGMQPLLHGKFNGVDLRLVMDSGAFGTNLFPSAVQKAGLRESHSDTLSSGVGGLSETYIATADEVEIGPSRGQKVRFQETVSANADVDGLLGVDYLFRTDLELLLRENKVVFLEPDHCDDKPIAYWDRDADWVESRDISHEDHRQKITVKINGQTISALLDSGAVQSVIDLKAAAEIGVTPDSAGTVLDGAQVGVGKGKLTVWRTRLDSFEIGNELIQHATIHIGDLFGTAKTEARRYRLTFEDQPDMILGADFMQAHHLLVSRSQRRLYFTYLGGPVFALQPAAPH